jgi:hypothetical protein
MPRSWTRQRGGAKVTRNLTASVWQEGHWFVAQCREVEVASQGRSEDEALGNLAEAVLLHFTPPVATVVPKIRELQVEISAP